MVQFMYCSSSAEKYACVKKSFIFSQAAAFNASVRQFFLETYKLSTTGVSESFRTL